MKNSGEWMQKIRSWHLYVAVIAAAIVITYIVGVFLNGVGSFIGLFLK